MMRFKINGIKIECPICRNDTFEKDYRQLNSRAATFFNFEWANKNAVILICKHCSHISWFMNEPN